MMKKILLLFVFILKLQILTLYAQSYQIGTYNLRMQTADDIGNLWQVRHKAISNLLNFHDFDVFGTQEGFKNQLEDLKNDLPQYDYYGIGRDDGKNLGEHSAVFYKKDKFTLLKSGDFWLSESPDKPSKGWDATCCNRLVSWVLLKDKHSNISFYFFNAHFDHEGDIARKQSSILVLKKIKEIAGNAPTIFTGDLNADANTECYQILQNSKFLSDTFLMAKNPYMPNGSYNGFKNPPIGKSLIDHIFCTKTFDIDKWGLLTDTYNGKFPSDHFPIFAKVKIKHGIQ